MTEPHNQDAPHSEPPTRSISPVKSTLAAIFGVQKDSSRVRDFSQGDPAQFIGVGIGVTIAIVVAMALFVRWVLAQ